MIRVIVPTLNAASGWSEFASALTACVDPQQVLIIDSESTDGTPQLAHAQGFSVHSIRRSEFNHGRTRQAAAEMSPEAEILIYLTQDAILADSESISSLLSAFDDPAVAVACGHQLPRKGAGAIEVHARLFNYPAVSSIRDMNARARLGFKTIFISNSFAAYKRSVLIEVGGFPQDVIFGEDTVTAARILRAGHKIAYIAQAKVYHSHSYTMMQEFQRYFDIGVLHNRESWMLEMFGGVRNEGNRYVASELKYLCRHDPSKIPSAILRSLLKYVGYRLGRMEDKLSIRVKNRLSMHRSFWSRPSRNS